MTDKKELDRVRAIHCWLDCITSPDRKHEAYYGDHTYSADEIREWPNIKSAMFSDLRLNNKIFGVTWDGRQTRYCYEAVDWRDRKTQLDSRCFRAYERGLCLHREMLGDAPALRECSGCDRSTSALDENGRCNECHIAANMRAEREAAIAGRPDPYAQHRAALQRRINGTKTYGDRELEALVGLRTQNLPGAEAARLRNVAALRKDLDRGLPRKATKFDPRPGIDDVGGFSSATWEE